VTVVPRRSSPGIWVGWDKWPTAFDIREVFAYKAPNIGRAYGHVRSAEPVVLDRVLELITVLRSQKNAERIAS
jgi:hypothetical protein